MKHTVYRPSSLPVLGGFTAVGESRYSGRTQRAPTKPFGGISTICDLSLPNGSLRNRLPGWRGHWLRDVRDATCPSASRHDVCVFLVHLTSVIWFLTPLR
jgi:hypothetical protein